MKSVRAFTLLELLVATAIFAVVAALAWGGLDLLARSRQVLEAEGGQLTTLQRGLGRFERDLRQALPRAARSESGGHLAAFLGDSQRLELSLWLPEGGWISPLPAVQRVAWRCHDGGLQRTRWLAVDRSLATPREQVEVLHGLSECRLRYYPERGQPQDRWPPREGAATVLPRAVELLLRRGEAEEFRRLIELPQNPDPAP